MEEKNFSNIPWVILQLSNRMFALSAFNVEQMIVLDKVVKVPNMPDHIRGVINNRGKVIPLLDMRRRLGISSLLDETNKLKDMIDMREKEHLEWLDELELSVKEHRVFEGELDPHKCAFGKWYDNYQSKNLMITNFLKRFDEPHKAVHSVAIEVEEHVEKDEFDRAFEIIQNTRDTIMSELTDLFDKFKQLLDETTREIAIIICNDKTKKLFAISVDSVESVERLMEDTIENLSEKYFMLDNELIKFIGTRKKDDTQVLILNPEKILDIDVSKIVQQPQEASA